MLQEDGGLADTFVRLIPGTGNQGIDISSVLGAVLPEFIVGV